LGVGLDAVLGVGLDAGLDAGRACFALCVACVACIPACLSVRLRPSFAPFALAACAPFASAVEDAPRPRRALDAIHSMRRAASAIRRALRP
jgi:hypothetical protein